MAKLFRPEDKSDIERRENGLEKVETFKGYTYILAGNRQAGVIADKLIEVLPEAVGNISHYPAGDDTFLKDSKSVAYGSLSALLIEAIKDLSGKVKAQQAEIDVLSGMMNLSEN